MPWRFTRESDRHILQIGVLVFRILVVLVKGVFRHRVTIGVLRRLLDVLSGCSDCLAYFELNNKLMLLVGAYCNTDLSGRETYGVYVVKFYFAV